MNIKDKIYKIRDEYVMLDSDLAELYDVETKRINEAVKNNVAIELCFRDVLRSYLAHRSKIISNFKDIYTLSLSVEKKLYDNLINL